MMAYACDTGSQQQEGQEFKVILTGRGQHETLSIKGRGKRNILNSSRANKL